VDEMDDAQAREHIEMVQRILAQTSQRLCAGGEFFVVWGLYSGFVTSINQVINDGLISPVWIWAVVPALAACVLFSILRGRATALDAGRKTLLQREFLNVLWLTIGLAFIANLGAFNLFRGWGNAAIWSFGEAIVLFYIGLHGNRRAMLGGIAVIVSMVVANFSAQTIAGYILAAGMVAGYTGFGIAEMLSRE